MTPYQLANQYCANSDEQGCAGLGIDDKLHTYRLWPRKVCDVATKRCPYFETHVAAHVRLLDPGAFRDSMVEAVKLYIRRLPQEMRSGAKVNILGKHPDEVFDGLSPARKCPKCGNPLAMRQRLCKKCAIVARLESKRAAAEQATSDRDS